MKTYTFEVIEISDFLEMLRIKEIEKAIESLTRYAMYETNHLNIEEIDKLMYDLEQMQIYTMYNDMGYIEIFN